MRMLDLISGRSSREEVADWAALWIVQRRHLLLTPLYGGRFNSYQVPICSTGLARKASTSTLRWTFMSGWISSRLGMCRRPQFRAVGGPAASAFHVQTLGGGNSVIAMGAGRC